MAKKKAKKRSKKVKKTPRQARGKAKKTKKKKKVVHKASAAKTKKISEKIVGLVDHFFGHISVAAFKVKSPLRVGDMIHIKGHTTDFVQRIDSIQSNHQSIPLAKKGVEIGIKVKGKCREGDTVFLAAQPPPASKKTASYENKKFFSF